MRRLRMVAAALAATLSAVVVSGCGLLPGGADDIPLPGGAKVGSDPITISADFTDVLDLVPQSSVKVDDVAVGRVGKITLNPGGKSARVELTINRSVQLPAGTTARLQQTSLLGEKYVALVRPTTPVSGPAIRSGDRLPLGDTSQAAQVEEVLGALSLVLNGGGIGQFQEISRELQRISAGRPGEIRQFLEQMNSFVGGLNARKKSITAAIDGLARLSRNLDADRDKIASALEGLSPGMQVIVDQRRDLVRMLSALDRLSGVTVDTLDRSRDNIVADLRALEPILTQLAKSGSDLPNSLQILLTYPFPDSVLGAIKGDYLNVFVETNFRTLPRGCQSTGCFWSQPDDPNYQQVPGGEQQGFRSPRSSMRTVPTPSQSATPSLLPPTSSSLPGTASPAVPVPTGSVPTGSASPKPGSGSSPTTGASGSAGSLGSSGPTPDSSQDGER